jgi:hypothetical protein
MPRAPARITQAEIARAIRAAKQAGAGGVEVNVQMGTIRISLDGKKPDELPPDEVIL